MSTEFKGNSATEEQTKYKIFETEMDTDFKYSFNPNTYVIELADGTSIDYDKSKPTGETAGETASETAGEPIIGSELPELIFPFDAIGPKTDETTGNVTNGPSDHLPVVNEGIVFNGNTIKALEFNTSFVTTLNPFFEKPASESAFIKYTRLKLARYIAENKDKYTDFLTENGVNVTETDVTETNANENEDKKALFEKNILGVLEDKTKPYFLMLGEFSTNLIEKFFADGGACAGLQEQNPTVDGIKRTVGYLSQRNSTLGFQSGAVYVFDWMCPCLLTVWDKDQLGNMEDLNCENFVRPDGSSGETYVDYDHGKDTEDTGKKKKALKQIKFDIVKENIGSYVGDLGHYFSYYINYDKTISDQREYRKSNDADDNGRPIIVTLLKKENSNNTNNYTILVNFNAPNFIPLEKIVNSNLLQGGKGENKIEYKTQPKQSNLNGNEIYDQKIEKLKNTIKYHIEKAFEKYSFDNDTIKTLDMILMCDTNDRNNGLGTIDIKIGNFMFNVNFDNGKKIKACCFNRDSAGIFDETTEQNTDFEKLDFEQIIQKISFSEAEKEAKTNKDPKNEVDKLKDKAGTLIMPYNRFDDFTLEDFERFYVNVNKDHYLNSGDYVIFCKGNPTEGNPTEGNPTETQQEPAPQSVNTEEEPTTSQVGGRKPRRKTVKKRHVRFGKRKSYKKNKKIPRISKRRRSVFRRCRTPRNKR